MRKSRLFLAVAVVALMAVVAGCKKDANDQPETVPDGWISIRTAADLNAVRDNLSGNYILMNDISLTKYPNWVPIGDGTTPDFTGKFNGNGHKITDLTINTNRLAGLFGFISGGSVSNLGVEIAADGVNGGNLVGGIAGYIDNGSTITNCYSTGNISSTSKSSAAVGGIAGSVWSSSTVIDCYSTGNISSIGWSGGIAGTADNCTITNCYSTGNISSSSNNAESGGIVGYAFGGTMANCYSTGDITGCGSGGIAGFIPNGTITNCYSTGSISYSGSDGICGGIAGQVDSGTITNCAAINSTINTQYAAGRITNVGSTIPYGIVSNNFASIDMKATGAAFNTNNTANQGVNKTLVELRIQSTYSDPINGDGLGGLGWKFGNDDDNPWKMPAGGGYPILYYQK